MVSHMSNSHMLFVESGNHERVVAFLKGISQDTLAKASLRSKAYTRAVMHFEAFILENKKDVEDHLKFLQVHTVFKLSFSYGTCTSKYFVNWLYIFLV